MRHLDRNAKRADHRRLYRVHRLPVIDARGSLVGILSLSDLVNAAPVASEEVTDTLSELSR
jgi:CBS domain-containing protein